MEHHHEAILFFLDRRIFLRQLSDIDSSFSSCMNGLFLRSGYKVIFFMDRRAFCEVHKDLSFFARVSHAVLVAFFFMD